MTLAAGSRLGPYEILAPIGAGGMGEVYKARDTRLERTVAVKVLPQHLSSSPEVRQRFEREAKMISQLSHPHISALYDVGREGETEYLVMEYLEGETLLERLAKGPLPLDATLRYGQEIADALDKAHRQGIVHRDLKPANVMLTKSGLKLLDFGLAKAMAPASTKSGLTSLPTQQGLTQEGTILGTFQYMAPEQLEGREADARTDIFAFGATLYEMATGRKAFSGSTQASLVSAIMASEPAPVSTIQPTSPPALDRVVKTCLAKDRENRWQNARDVGLELRWVEQDLDRPKAGAAGGGMRFRWRTHAVWAAVAITLALLAWAARRERTGALPPNPRPVIVLMDSPLPGRVYDPRTEAAGGTNADDLTDALRTLPVVIQKETTSPSWHREDQVVRQNPDLVVSHLSCLYDERVGKGLETVYEHLFRLAESRLVLYFGYVAEANPRTRFLVYSRTQFGKASGEQRWVSESEARLPVLRGRLHAFAVPGGPEGATFRDPDTARLIRQRVSEILGLGTS
jgi:predicted Ser/Thr protein kinase